MMEAHFDLAVLREQLRAKEGRAFWEKLAEWTDSEGFMDFLEQQHPRLAALLNTPLNRRELLKFAAASIVLAGLPACARQPREEIVPYVDMPERIVPGNPLYYATAFTLGGYAQGILAESHLGRPTKIEGNERHPASLGATDVFAQASVLSLYDPDRSKTVRKEGQISDWSLFSAAILEQRPVWQKRQGEGLYLLTETLTSPTLGDQLKRLLQAFPKARWHQYQPINRDNARLGAQIAFGEMVETVYHFEKAEVIVSLEADFFHAPPGRVRYAREFADKRRVRQGNSAMNRLYVIEGTPSITGAMADHRQPMQSRYIEGAVRALARRLGLKVPLEEPVPLPDAWLEAVVKDLQAHRGRCVIVAGDSQPPAVHALSHAMNERLGNFGATLTHTKPVELNPVDQGHSLAQLVQAMRAGQANSLLILGGNPVYDAPADLDFENALKKVPVRVHLGLYADETAQHCQWHVPAAHELESWGDARAFDGTLTLQQPLIAPLYEGKTPYEVLAILLGEPNLSAHEIVKGYWQGLDQKKDFATFWRQSLHDGLIAGTAAKPLEMSVQEELDLPDEAVDKTGLEIQFRPDPSIWDGRFANNGWLQELPKPLTKLTWSNAALINPATAGRLGLANGDVVELSYRGRTLKAPVWLIAGQAEGSVALALGYGRSQAGSIGNRAGVNAYRLRTSKAPWFDGGLRLKKTPRRVQLATTQQHHRMEGHDFVRTLTQEEFRRAPVVQPEIPEKSLYPPYRYPDHAWAMVIDLTTCIGCNACVAACQAENNIPIVGEEEVKRGREMHWLRIDTYEAEDPGPPAAYFQPVPCMHCELAPCEPVCPVFASVHDSEGLNNQVYNRCIGTRYCQANCPYKVRRFNFFDYAKTTAPPEDEHSAGLRAVRNPDVTVRSRGVMEKCTYCVQRISASRIRAKTEDRPIREGEVVTACQAACPTQAIIFGDLNNPESQVRKLKEQPHHYALLAELNTRPRTTYLAKLVNPNPDLEKARGER